MQLVACIKFYFLLLGSYILLFALAEDSIALDELDTSPNFRSLRVSRMITFGRDFPFPPAPTIFSDSEILTKISVDTASDPTDIVNFFPDVYVGADGGSKLYFGDLQYKTYVVNFISKLKQEPGFRARRTQFFLGLGTVDENKNFVGKVADYNVYEDVLLLYAPTPTKLSIVADSTVHVFFKDTNWRPVIIVDDNTTVTVTETYSEVKVGMFPSPIELTAYGAVLMSLESSVGAEGNMRAKVISHGKSFCLGIIKTVERRTSGDHGDIGRFVQGYFSDGESLWTNPNYAAIALHAQRRTSLIIDLQVTDEETLMTVWREGSKSGIRLKVNAIDATGYEHQIWAIYNNRHSITVESTTEPIPRYINNVCMDVDSCPDHYACQKTAEDLNQFRAGMCDVMHRNLGEGFYESESHLLTFTSDAENSGYDLTKRHRMSVDSRHVPLRFFLQENDDTEFAEKIYASITGVY